jgi:hypothetical protein
MYHMDVKMATVQEEQLAPTQGPTNLHYIRTHTSRETYTLCTLHSKPQEHGYMGEDTPAGGDQHQQAKCQSTSVSDVRRVRRLVAVIKVHQFHEVVN